MEAKILAGMLALLLAAGGLAYALSGAESAVGLASDGKPAATMRQMGMMAGNGAEAGLHGQMHNALQNGDYAKAEELHKQMHGNGEAGRMAGMHWDGEAGVQEMMAKMHGNSEAGQDAGGEGMREMMEAMHGKNPGGMHEDGEAGVQGTMAGMHGDAEGGNSGCRMGGGEAA